MPTAPWEAVNQAAKRLEDRAFEKKVTVTPLEYSKKTERLVMPDADILAQAVGVVIGTRDRDILKSLLSPESTPALQWIHALAAGVDQLPFDILKQRENVLVTHHRGISSRPLAEFACASFLHFLKHIPHMAQAQFNGSWERPPGGLPPRSLRNKTVGIIGFGSIGQEVGRICQKGFGMNVLAMRKRAVSEETLAYSGNCEVLSFDVDGIDGLHSILRKSDCILLAMPSISETVNLIGREELKCLRPGTIICNVGRGNAINEESLIDALNGSSDDFAQNICASLDVFAQEPLPPDSPLWKVSPQRLLISPHSADQTDEYWSAAAAAFEENAVEFLKGNEEEMGPVVDVKMGY